MNPSELLAQAEYLIDAGTRPPSEADLRRAISACYYALFHALLGDASALTAGTVHPVLGQAVRRTVEHAQLKRACALFERSLGNMPGVLQAAIAAPIEPELTRVVKIVPELQDARFAADYDAQKRVGRPDAEHWLKQARAAHDDWLAVRGTPNAVAFLTVVLFGDRLFKRG